MSATAGVLISVAAKIGAPILAELLKQKGGKKGKLAGAAIEAIASKLDVEPTPEAVVDRYEANPEEVRTVMRTVNDDFAQIAKAASDATLGYQQLLEGDRNSQSLLNRIWRPLNGILFGMEVTTIVAATSLKILEGDAATLSAIQPLYAFLGTILGCHASVVGVYVWRRTDEKLNGRQ